MSIGHNKDRILHRGRERKPRPKTFASEDSARKWAAAQGIKEYSLFNLRNEASSTKKIRIVRK